MASSTAAYPANDSRADGELRVLLPHGRTPTALRPDRWARAPLGGSYVNASTRAGQAGALLNQPGQSALFESTSSFLRTEVKDTGTDRLQHRDLVQVDHRTAAASLSGTANRVDLELRQRPSR